MKKIAIGKTGIILALVLLFAVLLRLEFFVGLNWSDDPGYVYDAHQILNKKFEPGYVNGLRSGMVYPVAASFALFGVSNASAALYPLLCSLGGIILAFHLGKTLLDEKVGLIAAFLLSFYPLDVIYATWIMPDSPLSFFTGLSIILFVLGDRADGMKGRALFFMSGLALGASYLLKVSGLLPALFFAAYAVARRRIRTDYAFVLAGLLLVVGLESIYTYSYSGDPFLRYHAVKEFFTGEDAVARHALNTDLKFYPRGMFNLNTGNGFNWNDRYNVNYGLFFYFVALSLLYCLAKREKKALVPTLWLLVFFIYLEFGSMSLTEFRPIHKLYRHLTVISIPCILLLAHFLHDNMRGHIVRRSFSIVVMAFLLSSSIYYTYGRHAYLKASTYDVRAMHEFLNDMPEKPVYTDGGAIGHIQFYFGFERNIYMRAVHSGVDCNDVKDAYVILNATRGWVEYQPFLEGMPDCFGEPPDDWELLRTVKGPEIDVFGRFDPVIYYAPA